jgi:hypothetical protein
MFAAKGSRPQAIKSLIRPKDTESAKQQQQTHEKDREG